MYFQLFLKTKLIVAVLKMEVEEKAITITTRKYHRDTTKLRVAGA